jgi:predicted metalloprotease with PDZ domain
MRPNRLLQHLCIIWGSLQASAAIIVSAQGLPGARYHLTVPGPVPREIQVDAWIPVRDGRFFMDSIQAQQLPRGWATFVRHLSVLDSAERPMSFAQADGASWVLTTPYQGSLHLRYGIDLEYARGTWPTGPKQSGLFFDSTLYTVTKALFIASNDLRQTRVDFSIPQGWRLSVPWDPILGSTNSYLVDDGTDLLRNSLVIGHHAAYEVREGPLTVLLALPGRMKLSSPLVQPALRKILREYAALFPRTPRTRLLVTFFYATAEDAEAFRKSVALTTADSVTTNSRVIWGNFLAHEIFHHWNGQAIRGVERDPRQYFNEGFTEYYANRTIVRTGLITPDLFLRKIETHLALYVYFRTSSAFSQISLQQAGSDKARYRFGVYQGGWTLAFCLDGAIREQTHDRKNLDDFMQRMYDLFGLADQPYRTEDIARVVSEVTGSDFSEYFRTYVSGTAMLPVRDCLHRMGFEGFGKPYAAEFYVFPSTIGTSAEAGRRASLTGTVWPDGPRRVR